MAISLHYGNLFTTKCQTLVNTVNCVGVMGKGLAQVFKLRYPGLLKAYQDACREKKLRIGMNWIYRVLDERWVLNFPTKFHWKYESKPEYLKQGLHHFLENYEKEGIVSVAFPLLGTLNGGLDPDEVKEMMINHLSKCHIPVEIWVFNPDSPDDIFEDFKKRFLQTSFLQLQKNSGLRRDKLRLIQNLLESDTIHSFAALLATENIGETTVERCFRFLHKTAQNEQGSFDF